MKGFLYHAHALGVAGHIDHPFKDVLEAQAPSALPVHGGYSRGRVENFRYKEIVSFKAAFTQVSGNFSPETNSWDTVMTSTVEGLNILDMVTCDRLIARLSSRHPIDGSEPSILPLGSRFEGLRLSGHYVPVTMNTSRYTRMDTHSKVVKAYRDNDEGFADEFNELHRVGQHEALPETHHSYFPWSKRKPDHEIPGADHLIAASLVKSLEHDRDRSDFEHHGHVIYLPHFGRVVLGQLIIDKRARRLTMLQVDLGCSVCGSVSAGSGEGNGTTMPPPPKDG